MAERRRVMVLPDLHVPNHDEACVEIVIKAAEVIRPDEVVILGDWIDGEAVSSHPPTSMDEDPSVLQDDYVTVNSIMDRISKAARGCSFSYIEGNHEQMCERAAIKMGGALGSSFYRALSPENCIAKARTDTKWIGYAKKELSFHKITEDLIAVHGWSASMHAAAAHLRKSRTVSVVYGHTHRLESKATRDPITGRPIQAFSPGCLCKMQPYYAHRNGPTEWTQGIAVVYVGRSGDWTNTTHIIKPTASGGKFAVLDGGKEVRV